MKTDHYHSSHSHFSAMREMIFAYKDDSAQFEESAPHPFTRDDFTQNFFNGIEGVVLL